MAVDNAVLSVGGNGHLRDGGNLHPLHTIEFVNSCVMMCAPRRVPARMEKTDWTQRDCGRIRKLLVPNHRHAALDRRTTAAENAELVRNDPKSTRGRLVRLPAKLLPKSTVMHIRHGPARGMKWISGSAVHGCWLGTYELEKQKLLERIVQPGMTVYDIGAQAGFYTFLCSKLVGDTGRVIAFEPSISEARYLLEHVRINQLANVSIVQAAVGASTSLSGFSSDRAICQNRLTAENDKLLVPVISLDSVTLPPPDVIKMDIEGGESDALKGARTLLVKHKPMFCSPYTAPNTRLLSGISSLMRLSGI